MGFIIKDQRPRRPQPAPLIALLIVTAPLILTATAEDLTPAPFARILIGHPDSPEWLIMRIETDRPDQRLLVESSFIAPRCPALWTFAILQDGPEHARMRAAVTFAAGSGRGGVELEGDVSVVAYGGVVERDGDEYCYLQELDVSFKLPEGTSHFVVFAAGAPFEFMATISPMGAGVRMAGLSSGDGVHYVEASEFEGTLHASVFSPRVDVMPLTYLSGGLVGANVAVDRWTQVTFENRPIYKFGTYFGHVSDAFVKDPEGRVTRYGTREVGPVKSGLAWTSSWDRPISEFPPGTYTFHINASVSASVPTPWVVVGVDARFPEE